MPDYPPYWEADVVAADGGVIHLRPIEPTDKDAILAFHAKLSERTRYLRYFSAYPRIPERDLIRFTEVDHRDRVAFVALLGGEIIAVGRYERESGTSEAEVAFVVADRHQGRGIGSVLLEHLAAAARERGLTRFMAVVLAENTGMLRVFRDAGYQPRTQMEYGEVVLTFDVADTETTETVKREREQRAEARSIARLLEPGSVAVVGASNDPGKIGNAVFRNLLRGGLQGTIYPVNPEARQVSGVRAYKSVLDIPDSIDLVVVAVPAPAVGEVVEQCAARGVRGLVVLSGGFGERGDGDGLARQRALIAEARTQGMRVVGPNCLGVINTDPDVRLNASLAPLAPARGRAGFFAQSGALGVAVLGEAQRRGLGVSTFVSAGNRADVSGNDLLQYWESDPATDVVLMYLESFGNPRKFARLARRLGRRKPIVAVKSSGAVVTALRNTTVEVPPESVQALFEASGVIRVGTLGELFDVALLLTTQPLPGGDRVAVVGNSTALAVLVRDALEADGLRMSRLIDVGVDAAPESFEQALGEALADDGVDAVVAVFVPPLLQTSGETYAIALRRAAAGAGKPVISTFLGFEGVPAGLAEPGPSAPTAGSIPSYSTPERAVRALTRAVRYARWRTRPAGELPRFPEADVKGARALVKDVLAATADGRPLDDAETRSLLRCYGIELEQPDEAQDGIGVVLDMYDDRSFGALVSFGIGGVATDLLGDRAYAAVPLTVADADDLVRGPKAAALLTGYGGRPRADLSALTDLALRLSTLSDDLPEVCACSLTVVAATDGAFVTAADVALAPPAARADTGPRRLPGF